MKKEWREGRKEGRRKFEERQNDSVLYTIFTKNT